MKKIKKEKRGPLYEIVPRVPIDDMNISCVYQIWFPIGDRYYIGRAKNLKARMTSHQSDINRLSRTWERDRKEMHYYVHLMDHITKTNSFVGYFSVLEICKDEDERVAGEQKWFDKCKGDSRCLNFGFTANPWIKRMPAGQME